MLLETHMKLCMTEPDFLKTNFFFTQCWENVAKMGSKQDFLNLLKNLAINFYWICCIVRIYIICYVAAQIQNL